MKEILELLGKTKKEVLAYLDEHQITYQIPSHNLICFETILLDDPLAFTINLVRNTVFQIKIEYGEMDSLNLVAFDNLVNKYKDCLNNLLGKPWQDNTNHPTDEIIIGYHNEKVIASIYALKTFNTEFNYQFIIALTQNNFNQSNVSFEKRTKLTNYLIYLVGGLIWGLVMFLTCSYENYNLTNFAIWMGGGLTFAIVFGISFEFFMNRTPLNKKPKTFKKKDYQKITEYEKKLKFNADFIGELLVGQRIKRKEYPAKIYLTDEKVLIVYLKKRKIIELTTTFLELDKYSLLFFDIEDEHYYFNLDNREENETIRDYLDQKLGYKSVEFQQLKEVIEKTFKEYNPYSLYDSTDEAFAYEIYAITKEFFKNPNLTFDELQEKMTMLLEDESEQVEKDLTTLVYQAVTNHKKR